MDIETYIEQFKIKLGNWVVQKHRIYLDTKYWIFMRDASLGKATVTQTKIYEKLKDLVKKEIAICPLSPHIFQELMKIGNEEKRLNMAQIMDELSQQVCFISPLDIVGQELLSFVRYCQAKERGKSLFNPAKYVFTKVALIMGEVSPTLEGIPDEHLNDIRVQFFDYCSNPKRTLVEMLKTMKTDFPQRNFENLIAQLNKGKDENQEWKSFHEVFMHEIAGFLDVVKGDIEKLWMYLYKNDKGCNTTLEEIRKSGGVKSLLNLIYHAFEQNKINKELPFFYIHASLHAFIRYNKTQRFKKDTLIDFSHAAWALPYCDTFFTEKCLHDWICSNLLSLDKLYGTQVLWREKDALNTLNHLG